MNATTLQSLHPALASVTGYGEVAEPSRYGARQAPNWIAIAAIVALHAIALAALVMFDVIHVGPRPREAPLVMTLIPLDTPPPAAPPPAAAVVETPKLTPVIVPQAVVKVVTPAPPIAVAAVVPPPAPVASAAPSAPAPPAPVAAPITPPSANAATLHNPAPRYPMDARRQKQEGTVRLRVVITVDGRVKDISIARSSGFDSLDEAALDAVRRWKFVPGMQAGTPIEAIGFVPIPFRLT